VYCIPFTASLRTWSASSLVSNSPKYTRLFGSGENPARHLFVRLLRLTPSPLFRRLAAYSSEVVLIILPDLLCLVGFVLHVLIPVALGSAGRR